MVVRRVLARAWLADPGREVAQARERAEDGDEDWQLWIDEYDRGEATLVDMRVSVTYERTDGSTQTVGVENHNVWMHLAVHPPLAAALIAEISAKDFDVITRRLGELGERITVTELEEMYVSVELDDGLTAALRPPADAGSGHDGEQARPGITTENA